MFMGVNRNLTQELLLLKENAILSEFEKKIYEETFALHGSEQLLMI